MNRRILAVDDEDIIRLLYKEILENKIIQMYFPRFELTIASQGEEAVKLVKEAYKDENPFALAYIDVRMPPGIDGLETAYQMRKIDKDIEIVLVTGYNDYSSNEIIQKVGTPRKLTFQKKPFTPTELILTSVSLTEKWNYERIKDDFVSIVSHELRSPLTSIIGFLDTLLRNPNMKSDMRQSFIQTIRKECIRLEDIIDKILRFEDLTKEHHKLEVSNIDVENLIPEIANQMQHLFENRNINFYYELCNVKQIKGEENLLREMLINLIENSSKFTKEGYVKLSCKKEDDNIVFVVEDTGCGIKEEEREIIFKKFTKGEQSIQNKRGLGLGLSIVADIVKKHKGKISFESQVNQGTKFIISMPIDITKKIDNNEQ